MRERVNRVYFFGTRDGRFIKVGKTDGPLQKRRTQLEKTIEGRIPLVLLAAIRDAPTTERLIHQHFAGFRLSETEESYRPEPELTEYVNWLRHQWFTTLEEAETLPDAVGWDLWKPSPYRRIGAPEADVSQLFNTHISFHGTLASTGWAWMATPEQVANDYYTPVPIIEAARLAMGGIDLDPASHWRANRAFKIPEYYHLNRDAMTHPWFGRVWLNPPYGENKRWFSRILDQWDSIEQLCMLSPVWAFTTLVASEFMERASACVLLSPTPEFWGRSDGRTGTNMPHAIVYAGNEPYKFLRAFRDFGIPVKLLTAENGISEAPETLGAPA